MRFEGSIDHAQQAAEGYLVIFRGAQMTLDAISAGDSARVQELLAGYPGGRSEGGSSGSRLKDTLHFRQMQACMVLGRVSAPASGQRPFRHSGEPNTGYRQGQDHG